MLFPKLSEEQWLELMLEPLVNKGLNIKELKEKGYAKNPAAEAIPWKDGHFDINQGNLR
jgi:hypothetical protein